MVISVFSFYRIILNYWFHAKKNFSTFLSIFDLIPFYPCSLYSSKNLNILHWKEILFDFSRDILIDFFFFSFFDNFWKSHHCSTVQRFKHFAQKFLPCPTYPQPSRIIFLVRYRFAFLPPSRGWACKTGKRWGEGEKNKRKKEKGRNNGGEGKTQWPSKQRKK